MKLLLLNGEYVKNKKIKNLNDEVPVGEYCRISMRLTEPDIKLARQTARLIGMKLDDIVNDIILALANNIDPVEKLAPLYKLRYAIKRRHASKSFDISLEKLAEYYCLIKDSDYIKRLTK